MVDAAAPPAGGLDPKTRADRPVEQGRHLLRLPALTPSTPISRPRWTACSRRRKARSGSAVGSTRRGPTCPWPRSARRPDNPVDRAGSHRARACEPRASWAGNHANGNFPPVSPRIRRIDHGRGPAPRLRSFGAKARPDIDLITLERLADEIGRVRNRTGASFFGTAQIFRSAWTSTAASMPRWGAQTPSGNARSIARRRASSGLAGGFRRREARTRPERSTTFSRRSSR